MRPCSVSIGDCRNNNNNNSVGDAKEYINSAKPSETDSNVAGCEDNDTSTSTVKVHAGCRRTANGISSSDNFKGEQPTAKRILIEMNTDKMGSNQSPSGSASLEPFIHQVTGRSHMLSLNSTTLCKSLLPRELLFYTSIPEDMRPHIPELKGVLYAQLEETESDEDHRFTTTQLFLKSNLGVDSSPQRDRTSADVVGNHPRLDSKWSSAYQTILYKGLERFKYGMTSGFSSHPWTVDKDAEAITESVGANPWAIRQHRREINLMLSRNGASPDRAPLKNPVDAEGKAVKGVGQNCSVPGKFLRGYLMLEDVTAGFKHPNVIDLKLGSQIERDDCSQAKKDKHLQLAKNSSTGTLMLRLAGMQVYQVGSGHYLCRDKYYGRGLSSAGFRDNMHQFLHNGREVMFEVIPPIIEGLVSLQSTLAKQSTFRFYASSLLILYEGGDVTNKASTDNICGCNQSHQADGTLNNGCQEEELKRADKVKAPRRRVLVRMIDFAHSTYKGFNGDKTQHEGPDQDCLEAITNLVAILRAIETEKNG